MTSSNKEAWLRVLCARYESELRDVTLPTATGLLGGMEKLKRLHSHSRYHRTSISSCVLRSSHVIASFAFCKAFNN
jgi:hypothetical protein